MTHALSADDVRRLADLERLCELARRGLPGEPVPCFARLRIQAAHGNVRDLLLGFRTDADGPVALLNWQTAPLAAVFFANDARGWWPLPDLFYRNNHGHAWVVIQAQGPDCAPR